MGKPSGIRDVSAADPHFVPLIYAEPGDGKTFLAGTSAQTDHDTLIIRPPTDHTDTLDIHFPHKIDEFVVDEWALMDEIHEYLRHEKHGYRWVWLDSITLWQDRGLDDIMEELVARKPHRDIYHPDKGEFLHNMRRLLRWTALMAALDFNFGMTAHVQRYTFDNMEEELLAPAIQGKQMVEKMSGMANIVGYLQVVKHNDEPRRVLHVTDTDDDEFYAKDGFGAFPKGRIIDPTIPKIEKAVEAAKKKGKGKPTTRKKTAGKKTTAAKKAATTKTSKTEEDSPFVFD